ncbi:hypothetical protein H2200_006234 [Cladophialophora chaetospira]|uniref:Uncharacterized protein n=1 Tax=Cladophialophora chaetospira TaxID=386627 RepID=A0AA38XAR3_9EURO|nr:hypothetical protein H2200_006234 [Cladophialophora chaetospira]
MEQLRTYRFIYGTKVPYDARTNELTRSEARSHAATISGYRFAHLRNALGSSSAESLSQYHSAGGLDTTLAGTEKRNGALKRHKKIVLPNTSKFRFIYSNKQNGELAPVESLPISTYMHKQRLSTRMPRPISKSSLDPFFRPAVEVSVPDSHLMQLYLLTISDGIHGTSSTPALKNFTDLGKQIMEENEIAFLWVLLAVECRVTTFQRTDHDRKVSILSRRNSIYRLMNAQLDPISPPSDQFLYSVATAALIENRLGDIQRSRHHRKGLKYLLHLRGGLKATEQLPLPMRVQYASFFLELGYEELFQTADEVQVASRVAHMQAKLLQLQNWNHDLRLGSNPDSISLEDMISKEPKSIIPGLQLNQRICALQTPSLLNYVTPDSNILDDAQQRFYLATLYTINATLSAYRASYQASDAYLELLIESTEKSIVANNSILQCFASKFPSWMLLFMIGQDVAESFDGVAADLLATPEEVFEFVEITMMLSSRDRYSAMSALRSWLTSPDEARLLRLTPELLNRMVEVTKLCSRDMET